MPGSPGTHAIIEVTTQLLSADVPRDFMVNHWAADSTGVGLSPANWQALSDAFKNFHFATTGTHAKYGDSFGGKVVVYNRADPTPRPEKGFSNFTPSTWATAISWPRQVCCRLSMYGFRNLPRRRGGVYLPPENSMSTAERISSTNMTRFLQYGVQLNAALAALTPNWQLDVWSLKDDTNYPVDHWWVNDVWDIQRRRAPKEITRQHSP